MTQPRQPTPHCRAHCHVQCRRGVVTRHLGLWIFWGLSPGDRGRSTWYQATAAPQCKSLPGKTPDQAPASSEIREYPWDCVLPIPCGKVIWRCDFRRNIMSTQTMKPSDLTSSYLAPGHRGAQQRGQYNQSVTCHCVSFCKLGRYQMPIF
jgi:hypothetical protein